MSVFSKKTSLLCCLLFSLLSPLSTHAVQAKEPIANASEQVHPAIEKILRDNPDALGINITVSHGTSTNNDGPVRGKFYIDREGHVHVYVKQGNKVIASKYIGHATNLTSSALDDTNTFFNEHIKNVQPHPYEFKVTGRKPGGMVEYLGNQPQDPRQ